MARYQIYQRLLPHTLFGAIVFILVISVTEVMVSLLQENHLERQKMAVIDKAAAMRAKIEGEINSLLFLSSGLMAFVASNPDLSEEEFIQFASDIVVAGRNIRNIGLAKNNVLTYIYPLAGNEAALGLEYEKEAAQWPAVKKAMDLNGTTVAGPINLVQGGKGFIARTPIYTRFGVGGHIARYKPYYWGMASIVIDANGFLKTSGFLEVKDEIQFALRGKNGLGVDGDIISGDIELFSQDSVVAPITLPNGSWQIAARPRDGWGSGLDSTNLPRFLGWFSAVVLGLVITALSRAREINRELSLLDYLTNLPNRRLLADRLDQALALSNRTGSSFCVYSIDLDGFKEINDTYGHKTGDNLIIEASKRMLASVRAIDTVARTGGDEFIILIGQLAQENDVIKIKRQIIRNLDGTVFVDGHRIELSASIGTAVFPTDGDTIEVLLQKADQDMYKEKQFRKQ